ncbi:hypothetical protein D9758_010149 [Tetrapyrgos nigripes]|uniref:F-box domain-containing protein n=1 Tax=Tetrapyrgos nigripes TaxID=182062 RepID=A0A8H5CSB3_9AGAR|nr:hypothetical protein D9758_010149 [Tetrapyrgos nigripes]
MHHALQIPELLHKIFGYLTKKDQKQCVPVCKLWSEIALDYIWRVISPVEIAWTSLLAPLKQQPYIFESSPTGEAWNRFLSKYSKRIRRLSLVYFGRSDASALLSVMNQTRPQSLILPNLHTLGCFGQWKQLDDTRMLMHDGIQVFTINTYLPQSHWELPLSNLLDLTETIQARMPRLTSLTMTVPTRQEFAEPLAALLENLPVLTRIAIPSFKDISPILKSLSSSTVPQRLKFVGLMGAVSQVGPLGSEGHVALEELEIRAADTQTIIPLLPHLPNVRVLDITITSLDSNSKCLFGAISAHCTGLDTLKMAFLRGQHPFNFDVLQAIFPCVNITTLDILGGPVNMSDSDIVQIALAWPRLKKFRLSERLKVRDTVNNTPKTTLWAIFVLTRLCSQLKCIELSMNTSPRDIPPFDTSFLPSGFQAAQSASLDVMHFDYSKLEQGDELVLVDLLDRVLPVHCSVQSRQFDPQQNRRWRTLVRMFPRSSRDSDERLAE